MSKTGWVIVTIIIGLQMLWFWKLGSLEYHQDELKRDSFVIQVINSIIEQDHQFLEKNTDLEWAELEWKAKLVPEYSITKDTGLGYVEYVICFSNGFLLFLDTGKKLNSSYGGAVFRISTIGPLEEYGECDPTPQGPQGRYYLNGNHRVYCY